MGSCQLFATPNGTWTAGAMSLAPSKCRSWSSKNRCGRSAWIIMVLSWPSMKATSSTLTPMDFSVLMTLASAGMPLLAPPLPSPLILGLRHHCDSWPDGQVAGQTRSRHCQGETATADTGIASALTGQIYHLSGHQALAVESRRTILSEVYC